MRTVIVVGAGIWGLSLALRLADEGVEVTLVEQYAAGHLRQASSGETRLLRSSHGGDEWYARLAWKAREGWRRLGERAGEELYLEVGTAWFARNDDGWERRSAAVLAGLDIPHELLDPVEGGRLFPGFRGDDLAFLLWEPKAGVIRARRATQVTAGLARQAGVRFVRGFATPVPERPAVRVEGTEHAADAVVWACGAWLGRLFPLPLQVTKQDTVHFAVPAGWSSPQVPSWVDYEASAYGHGDVDGSGFKATSDVEGGAYEPDAGSRAVDAESVEAARAYLRRRFPPLAEAPVLLGQVCQYTLTADAQWIITESSPGVWLLGGDSGHGFKHAPALAEYVAGLLRGEYAPEARFGPHERSPARGLRTSGHQ
jgi:sarcosine oxidase